MAPHLPTIPQEDEFTYCLDNQPKTLALLCESKRISRLKKNASPFNYAILSTGGVFSSNELARWLSLMALNARKINTARRYFLLINTSNHWLGVDCFWNGSTAAFLVLDLAGNNAQFKVLKNIRKFFPDSQVAMFVPRITDRNGTSFVESLQHNNGGCSILTFYALSRISHLNPSQLHQQLAAHCKMKTHQEGHYLRFDLPMIDTSLPMLQCLLMCCQSLTTLQKMPNSNKAISAKLTKYLRQQENTGKEINAIAILKNERYSTKIIKALMDFNPCRVSVIQETRVGYHHWQFDTKSSDPLAQTTVNSIRQSILINRPTTRRSYIGQKLEMKPAHDGIISYLLALDLQNIPVHQQLTEYFQQLIYVLGYLELTNNNGRTSALLLESFPCNRL